MKVDESYLLGVDRFTRKNECCEFFQLSLLEAENIIGQAVIVYTTELRNF